MLSIAREHHLAVFDSRHYYVASFLFQLSLPEAKNKNEQKGE
jgi:hypothetical protein